MNRNMAAAALDLLRAREVRYLFCLPGSTEAPLLDALSETDPSEGPELVLGLHESSVAAMADGYARVSGEVGVVVLHTTVGSANGLSQLYNAYTDYSSVHALIGHKDSSLYNRSGFCTTDYLPNWYGPVTKHATQVFRADDVVADLERQLDRSLHQPPRPTALVVPQEFWEAAAEDGTSGRGVSRTVIPSAADPLAVSAIRERLAAATAPILLVGDWVHRESAQDLVVRLAEAFDADLVGEPRRSASIRTWLSSAPRYVGDYENARERVAGADLILALGAKTFVEFEAGEQLIAEGERLVIVHPNLAEADARARAGLIVESHVRPLLDALCAEVAPLEHELSYEPASREEQDSILRSDAVTAGDVACLLDHRIADDAIIIDEAVRSSDVMLRRLNLGPARTYHRSTGGALGWGIGAAVGAQIAAPDKEVVCLLGDGAAMLSIQTLWTAAQRQLPILFVIVNNRGYRAVQEGVDRFRRGGTGKKAPGVSFGGEVIQFEELARGQGIDGRTTSNGEELAAAIEHWKGLRAPFVIDHRVPDTL